MVEYKNNELDTIWMEIAQVGKGNLVGCGDIIFTKLERSTDSFRYDYGLMLNTAIENGNIENSKTEDEKISDKIKIAISKLSRKLTSSDFMYYDFAKRQFLSNEQWWKDKHYNERINANKKENLPKTYIEAEEQGFERLPRYAAVYHGSDIGNLKYIHKDGREVIFKVVGSGFIVDETYYINSKPGRNPIKYDSYKNSEMFTFIQACFEDGYTDIGDTYNYAYSTSAGKYFNAHFYFDMLTYYWWESTEELYKKIDKIITFHYMI